MAPGALSDSNDFPSQIAKPMSLGSCNFSYLGASGAPQDPISHGSDSLKNGPRDLQVSVTECDGAELQKNESTRDTMINGHAMDLQKSISQREIVFNGHAGDVHKCGSVVMRNHQSNFPGSFNLPTRQSPPPTPPPSPPKNNGQMLLLSYIPGIVRDCKTIGHLCVPKELVDILDKLFMEGYNADVAIHTEDGGVIAAHSTILAAVSPVLRGLLDDAITWPCRISVKGVPYNAAKVFIRFLYSSRYEQEEMEDFIVHLLVLSHAYSVPSLKRVCTLHWEQGLLTHENVVDILQTAKLCDAPRLHMLCCRVVLSAFKEVSRTEGWRVMREANPELEQELVEAVIEADYRKKEKLRKMEDARVYEQLHDAMEALIHICSDGCRTIGPHDKVFDSKQQGSCNYPACKGLESLVRHFAGCKLKVSGGCIHCKRMWQLLELHSRMCKETNCKVPLCGHFKNKIGQHQGKRDETRWRLLVNKVVYAKRASAAFSIAEVSTTLDQVSQI